MRHSVFLVCCVVLTLTVWTSALAWAADARLSGDARALLRAGRQGTVVAVGPGTLTMTERAGKNPHTYAVASDAVITYEGQVCMLTDVRVGDMVTVTTDTQAGTTVATTIKARQAGR
ncbi:MAG TPA: hypothetical protein VLQ80_30860 [Candidatus Saccharimonadia bacterium]|nr:hypothetical protein [Candidatus Saccharimonadia bacterium]